LYGLLFIIFYADIVCAFVFTFVGNSTPVLNVDTCYDSSVYSVKKTIKAK